MGLHPVCIGNCIAITDIHVASLPVAEVPQGWPSLLHFMQIR